MRGLVVPAIALVAGCELLVQPPPHEDHPDLLVNSITLGSQANVAGVFASERYFVVWQDSSATPPDTDKKAIRGRFLSKTGVPQASDILINATPAGSQDHPQVAAIGTDLLVVWSDDSSGEPNLTGRVMSTLGQFLTDEIHINTTIPGVQLGHQLVATANSFVVVWADESMMPPDTDQHGIRGRRFDAAGTPLDAEDFVINTTVIGNQYEPAIALGSDGRMLVVWTDAQTGEGGDIRGRLLGSDGQPTGTDFVINTTTPMIQEQPYVIGLPEGYLVAWTDGSQSAIDIDGKAIRARRLDRNGGGMGGDFLLNTRTQGDQAHPRMIQLPDGSIFLSFEDGSQLPPDTSGNGVRERRLASDGTPMTDEHEVNTYYPADQEDTALAIDPDGNVLLLWEDGGASPPDESSDSVRARLYPPGT